MKRLARALVVVLAVMVVAAGLWLSLGLLWPLSVAKPGQRPERLVVRNVALVDVETGSIRGGQDILIESGVIAAVGEGLETVDALEFDGGGGFAIPGLFDMHVHNTKLSPVLMHPLFVAAGVTAVRDMGGCLDVEDGFVACLDEKREWNRAVTAGEMVGPRFDQVTSLALNGGRAVPAGQDPALGGSTPEGARARVTLDRERGVDFLKTYSMLPRDAYLALADEASKTGLYLAGHLPLAVSGREAVEAGQRSIEHAFLFIWECYPGMESLRDVGDPRQVFTNEYRRAMIEQHNAALCSDLHGRMVEAGTAFVPTHTTRKLDAFATDEAYRTDPRLRFIPGPLRWMWLGDADAMAARAGESPDDQASYMDFYQFGLEQTGIAHGAGVAVLAGSDAPDSFAFPGTGLHDELAHLVQAGLSPLDALRSATLEPARFLGLEGRAGVLRPGARADVVLLGSNPLGDIQAVGDVEAVILAGAVYDRGDLDAMLEGVERAAGSWSMWPRFLWRIATSPIMKKQFAD